MQSELSKEDISGNHGRIPALQFFLIDHRDIKNRNPEHFAEVIYKKRVKVSYDQESFRHLKVNANAWLLENSVISNILSHLFIHSEDNARLDIRHEKNFQTHQILFEITPVSPSVTNHSQSVINRRIEVASKVLQIHGGDLFIDHKEKDKMIIRMRLPR